MQPLFAMPQQGDFDIRFMPPKKGGKMYVPIRYHRLHPVGITGAQSVHQCHRRYDHSNGKWDGWCEYCDVYATCLRMAQNVVVHQPVTADDYRRMAQTIKPYDRYYYNVIVREYTDPKTKIYTENAGPMIYGIGRTLHTIVIKSIVGEPSPMLGRQKSLGDVTHYLNGRDFRVRRTFNHAGGVHYPMYDSSSFLDISKAGNEAEWVRWMQQLPDLDALYKLEDAATVTAHCKAFMNIEEPKPKPKKSRYRSVDDDWEV